MLLSLVLPALALAPAALAWNTDVHNQIGVSGRRSRAFTSIADHVRVQYMAEEFLHPMTKSVIGQILEPMYNGSIGMAAGESFASAGLK